MKSQNNEKRRSICILIGDVSLDFTEGLISGITDAATREDINVVFLMGMQKYSEQSIREEKNSVAINYNSVYDYASLSGADAFIIACGSLSGLYGNEQYEKFLERFENKPYIVLQVRVPIKASNQAYIIVNNYQSYFKCIEHLIVEHGFRKIALLSGPKDHADAVERMRAYLECMSKHHLPVTSEMIAYGDFSEYVDDQVESLIYSNPGLEAIAFANDEMAKAGYRVCRERGLVIGQDIAITGFDNFSTCQVMDPPLSTVSQDVYKMGRTAFEKTIDMLDGKSVVSLEMETELVLRQSCGCKREDFCFLPSSEESNTNKFISLAIDSIIEEYKSHFAHHEYEKNYNSLLECLNYLRTYVLEEEREALDKQKLSSYFSDFFAKYSHPIFPLAQSIENTLQKILYDHKHSQAIRKFAIAISYLQQYAYTNALHARDERYDQYRTQSWIAPELTRGLLDKLDDTRIFSSVIRRLQSAGLYNVYICLLDNPNRISVNGMSTIPTQLKLVSEANLENTADLRGINTLQIDSDHPINDITDFFKAGPMMGFSIFSGANQYGLMFCEMDKSKSAFFHMIGLQLGMLINFMELRKQEDAIEKELENIREKNEILNFLSEYDQMCGLLNRRGFIERAIRRNRENIGKTAYCIFIDLDYLKQINDTFGHAEGDVALRAVSQVLHNCSSADDLIGRIGGDEFVGLFVTEDPHFEATFMKKIKMQTQKYNIRSGKPYFVDMSVGIACFTCQQGLEIGNVIAEADQYLYEAKKKRSSKALRYKPKPEKTKSKAGGAVAETPKP